ncbi:MAG: exodeoxyribonuclease VII small subunit [Lachnospiraceae bacterium]|nr:exodeoxyribonuclease VII small subunit [Lachnospiraceae bacterium]MCR4685379.1 exodeoxyribonuclease VII small subunit [Lachnospiraceae bacterium]
MNKEELKKMSINDAFASVEETMDKLRSDEISLEESFALYKEGVEILKACAEKIDTVEKKVQKLDEEGNISDF